MTRSLQMGQLVDGGGFLLPPEAVTSTFGVLAMRGSGKSNTGAVFAEEFWDLGLQFVVVEPKGDYHGLRSSRDGTGPGLPIPVFGGLHGDLPLAHTAGAVMAELIKSTGMSCILDISDFDTKAQQVRFLTDFGTALYRAARRDPSPLHLIIEEADEILPQQVSSDMAKCVGIWTKIIKLGRTAGLGATLITQRSASINKGALTQIDTLIALRTTSPTDRKVIRDWVHGAAEGADLVDSLPGLEPGEAWVWSPQFLGRTVRVQFRQRRTFDSGATPAPGQKRTVPVLADIDLSAVAAQIEATVEEHKANDPKALRARVKELEKQLAEAPAAEPVEVVREVIPSLLASDVQQLGTEVEGLVSAVDALQRLAKALGSQVAAGLADMVERSFTPPPRRLVATSPKPAPRQPAAKTGRVTPLEWPTGKGERRILTVLALHGPTMAKKRLALMAEYAIGGGGFSNLLSKLRTGGYITTGTDPITLTDEAEAGQPDDLAHLPQGEALLNFWLDKLSRTSAPSKILAVLVDCPDGITREQLAIEAGYEPSGGGYSNALSKLRTLELAEGGTRGQLVYPAPHFMEAIGR